jgi:hypothetical protein
VLLFFIKGGRIPVEVFSLLEERGRGSSPHSDDWRLQALFSRGTAAVAGTSTSDPSSFFEFPIVLNVRHGLPYGETDPIASLFSLRRMSRQLDYPGPHHRPRASGPGTGRGQESHTIDLRASALLQPWSSAEGADGCVLFCIESARPRVKPHARVIRSTLVGQAIIGPVAPSGHCSSFIWSQELLIVTRENTLRCGTSEIWLIERAKTFRV